MRLPSGVSRHVSEWSWWHYGYAERVCLRFGGDQASGARQNRKGSADTANKRRRPKGSRKPIARSGVNNAAREHRHKDKWCGVSWCVRRGSDDCLPRSRDLCRLPIQWSSPMFQWQGVALSVPPCRNRACPIGNRRSVPRAALQNPLSPEPRDARSTQGGDTPILSDEYLKKSCRKPP